MDTKGQVTQSNRILTWNTAWGPKRIWIGVSLVIPDRKKVSAWIVDQIKDRRKVTHLTSRMLKHEARVLTSNNAAES